MVGLLQVPAVSQFDIAGYTNVATHRQKTPGGVDVDKLKEIAKGTWTSIGLNRLLKVFPTIRHHASMDPDIQYPPGQGVSQWVLKGQHFAKVLAVVTGYPDARLPPSGR